MLLITGGILVDAAGERAGDVLVDGERIRDVGPDLQVPGAEVVDASGAYVVPGAVDVHTHFALPVGAVRSADDFESGTIAAACGGTTCVVDFAGAGREAPEEALETWHAKADGRAVVDYGFHLTVTSVPEDRAEAVGLFRGFVERGVSSVKLYMAYPDRLMVDDETLGRAFVAGRGVGVRTCVHAEDGMEVERSITESIAEGLTGPAAITRSRPPSAEASAVTRAAGLAREAGTSVYVVHLSSEAGLRAVNAARAEGASVLAETCPHYLFLTEDRLTGPPEEAQDFVCQPPLRTDPDRLALWRGLADGSVRTVATDHCPFTRADRRRGTGDGGEWADFRQIPGGLPGVETRMALVYQGVRDGRLSLKRWVDVVATEPARLFGMAHRKGTLAPGMDADLVVFDPGATKVLEAGRLHMRTDHSPYQGMSVTGWPALTFSRGRLVAREGEPADALPGWGRFVPRLPVTL